MENKIAKTALPLGRRIFVASTHDDLVDVRAELYRYLLELGLIPIMSEGRFPPTRDTKESVEARCLANIEMADVVLVILSERYGSIPKKHRISYTHLEFRQAEKHRKKILVYVRTALWALRERCKKDSGAISELRKKYAAAYQRHLNSGQTDPAKLVKVTPRDQVPRLLAFVHECEQPKHRGKQIIRTFDTVVDLKDHIRNDLTANLLVASYEELLREGRLPFISVSDARPRARPPSMMDLYLRLVNTSRTPATFGADSGLYFEYKSSTTSTIPSSTHHRILPTDDTERTELNRASGALVLKGRRLCRLIPSGDGIWRHSAAFAQPISTQDWSPMCPSVMREGDEYMARLDLATERTKEDEDSIAIRLWVIYQSPMGLAHRIADAYDVTLRKGVEVGIRSVGKHIVFDFDALKVDESGSAS